MVSVSRGYFDFSVGELHAYDGPEAHLFMQVCVLFYCDSVRLFALRAQWRCQERRQSLLR